jgi:hypothetical protein
MIDKVICESDSEKNYDELSEERKEIYRGFYNEILCCPEHYILSVDVSNPNTKDYSCMIKYNYEEYLKGNLVVEKIKQF